MSTALKTKLYLVLTLTNILVTAYVTNVIKHIKCII